MPTISKQQNKYLLRFDKGQELFQELIDFCEKNNINAGFFYGLGACQEVELAWYNLENKKYTNKIIKQKLEIISLFGNIAKLKNKLIIHAHSSFSNKNMQVLAGHLNKLVVAATCEIYLQVFDCEIQREYSQEIGLNLLKS